MIFITNKGSRYGLEQHNLSTTRVYSTVQKEDLVVVHHRVCLENYWLDRLEFGLD